MVAPAELMSEAPADVETFILVDVDGVLNVGLYDGGNAPILLVDTNLNSARQYQTMQKAKGGPANESVDKLVYLAGFSLGVEEEEEDRSEGPDRLSRNSGGAKDWTFESLCCQSPSETSEILVERLAKLIEAAGKNCNVVLSSNWRRKKNIDRVRKLEANLGEKLGRHFTFTESTAQCMERTAGDRLRCMGDYISQKALAEDGTRRLRFLCLEDFFITGMDGWACDGDEMHSVAAVEQYLLQRSTEERNLDVDVKVIHTFTEIETDGGLKGKVGSGLTMKHMNEALNFLAQPAVEAKKIAELEESLVTAEAILPVSPLSTVSKDPTAAGGSLLMTPDWLEEMPGKRITAGLQMPMMLQAYVVAG